MTSNPFHPLKIGSLKLKNNLIAAPMAGLSSLPYRLLAIEEGCALAISEMVSAEGTIRAHERTRRYFINDEKARPFGVQLFGANPKAIAEAIRIIDDTPPPNLPHQGGGIDRVVDLIDINMGCPVKKVCSKGAGAALMRAPNLAAEIISAVRSATKKPLTVKIRAGWDASSVNCVEIAKIAEDCGADAVIVHPRTREQMFKGKPDWSLIGDVKAKLKIPVIGNGDVKNRGDAIRMFGETDCDGIMIGRAAVGNPWIFGKILNEAAPDPTREERARSAIRHFDRLCDLQGAHFGLVGMRTILPWYGKGLRGVKKFMQDVYKTKDAEELKAMIAEFFKAY